MPYGTRSTIRTTVTRGGTGGGGAGGADCGPTGLPMQLSIATATSPGRIMVTSVPLARRDHRLDLQRAGGIQVGKPPINDGLVPFEASLGHHTREPHRARLPVDGAVKLGDERAPARTCSGDPPACLDLPDRVGGLHQAAEGLERDDQGAVHGAAHLAGPEIAVVVGLADALELPDEGEGDSVRTGSTG